MPDNSFSNCTCGQDPVPQFSESAPLFIIQCCGSGSGTFSRIRNYGSGYSKKDKADKLKFLRITYRPEDSGLQYSTGNVGLKQCEIEKGKYFSLKILLL